MNLPKLSDFKHLHHLNSIKNLLIILLILTTVYLLVKSPKIETSMSIQLDELKQDTILHDTIIDIE